MRYLYIIEWVEVLELIELWGHSGAESDQIRTTLSVELPDLLIKDVLEEHLDKGT
jgi:hypothetical protein